MNTRTAANQFPDLGYELPSILGFHDTSWSNDICASMENADGSIRIWFDYAHPSKRESGSAWQFSITMGEDTVLMSNDITETIMKALKEDGHELGTGA
jgi:hypothetical protein